MKAQLSSTTNTQYSTLLYNSRHLILKWASDKDPFVIAECYSSETADLICELLQAKEETNES